MKSDPMKYRTEITDSCAVADRLEAINETLNIISNQLFDIFNEEGDGEVKVRIVKENK